MMTFSIRKWLHSLNNARPVSRIRRRKVRRYEALRQDSLTQLLETRVLLAADWGDAPLLYPTLGVQNGAQHTTGGALKLGTTVDSEANGTPSANADGDGADEDGVTFGTIRVGALGATVTVNVTGGTGKLDAWIDFNGDGSWGGPGEQIFASQNVVAGNNNLTFDVPSWAKDGVTFARFRLSTAGGLGTEGLAADGEVEDYAVTVIPPAAAAGVFRGQNTVTGLTNGANSVFAADVDGDGDMDMLSTSTYDDKIAWYENDGSQNFTEHTISTVANGANSVFAADVDEDGDLDILSASFNDDRIAWYENDGKQNFTAHTISTSADNARSVFAADVDGDGDTDVLSASLYDDKVAWYENDGSQNFTEHTISTAANGACSVFAVDINGDGDTDVISASQFDNRIAWFENDGNQNFTPHTISFDAVGARSVFAADVDTDGDLDILSASYNDDKIAWYENLPTDFGDAPTPYPTTLAENGAFHISTGPALGATRDTEANGTHSSNSDADGADEDGVTFGTIQVGALGATVTVNVTGGTGKLDAWIDFNGDGSWGGPGEQIFASQNVVVGSNNLTIDVPSWAKDGVTFARFRLSTAGGLGTKGLAADGEVEDYAVTVIPPVAAIGTFGGQNVVTTGADSAQSVFAADVDGDGDMDMLSASSTDRKIAWYENDGSQNFTPHPINTNAFGAFSVSAADVDGDGDTDVLSASNYDDKIAWYENDGSQNFIAHTISTSADNARSVFAADVDGDGDTDVLSASFFDDKIAWYENDGSQNFTEHTISTSADAAASVFAADVDGDGDLDILSASYRDDKIAWYENDGSQNFTTHTISTAADGAFSVFSADVDGDGDTDILSASYKDDKIAWYQNDGSQNFTALTISTATNLAFSVFAADLDGDGDTDVLSASRRDDKIAWYENLPPDFGDAPVPYPTTLGENGAIHGVNGPVLGATRDGESNGTHSSNSDADGADEDGVTFGTIQAGALGATVTVNVTGGTGKLDAWIDFNGDGSWGGPGEQIFASQNVVVGNNNLTFDVPSWAKDGVTFARFRLSTAGGLGTEGLSVDGEVEDYAVTVIPPNAASGVFDGQKLVTNGANAPVNVFAADVDGDGDMDMLSASPFDLTIAWYENDGSQKFTPHPINTNAFGAWSVFAADVDGDGDIDVLSASYADDTIAWYENDGSQNFTAHTISTVADGTLSVFAADVDGDGDTDVLSASLDDDKIAWYENNGSQNFTEHTISTIPDGAVSVFAADVDGDGDMDVLSASFYDARIAWYENDGSQKFTPHTISTAASQARSVFAADVDGDGDLDVLSASRNDNKIAWYENDGSQNFTEHTISTAAFGTSSVFAADVDGDGDIDVLSASYDSDTIAWYENDGSQNFTTHTITTAADGALSVFAADVDGDGDTDVISSSLMDDNISWYENLAVDFGDAPAPYPTTLAENGARHIFTGPTLGTNRDRDTSGTHSANADADDTAGSPDDEDGVTFGTIQVGALGASVTVNVAGGTGKLDAWIDFNGDGSWGGPGEQIFASQNVVAGINNLTFDVPSWAIAGVTYTRFRLSSAGGLGVIGSAADGEVEDYQVTVASPAAANGIFGGQNTVTTGADGATSVFAADVDGDGDMDMLSASQNDDKIAWYENDGSQNFTAHTISNAADFARSVFAADVDGDGDTDVLSASTADDRIVWYENDGSQNFTAHTISTAADGAYSVFAADVDGDGDMDVLSASKFDDQIAWYENDGSQNFTAHTISTAADAAYSVFAADVDGDGDTDVLSASLFDDKIAWYENDGSQNFTARTISTAADGAKSVFAADLDGDGEMDVLSASKFDDKIAWYENDGSQNFTAHTISTAADAAYSVFAADVDGDGDLDVLSASYLDSRIAWYENGANLAPTAVTLTPSSSSLAENISTASAITLATIDLTDDSQGTNDLSLSGADAAFFEIVGNELRLIAGTTLDFETKSSYSVTVEVNDAAVGGSPDASTTFTLSVLNLLDTTTSPDAFVLTYTASDVTITHSVNGGPAANLGTFPLAPPITLNGLDANDSVRVVGTAGNDVISVSSSGITINGAGLILNGPAARTLAGEAGDDTYEFDADNILGLYTLDESGGGIDTIDLSPTTTAGISLHLGTAGTQVVQGANLSLVLGSGTTFENAVGGSGNDTLTGNVLGNSLQGRAGNDTLNGFTGSDALAGGAGDDTYVFGAAGIGELDTLTELSGSGSGIDTLNFAAVTTAVTINLGSTATQPVHGTRSLVLNLSYTFENVLGGSGNDRITGNTRANLLSGRNGNDTLNGFLGNDSLLGGAGDDSYVFGASSPGELDTLTEASDAGSDTLDFAAMLTSVTVNLGMTGSQLVDGTRSISLNQTNTFENARGGAGDDFLTGGSGNNILDGRNGHDTLNGFTGSDTLRGGAGNDTYLFGAASSGETDVLTEASNSGSDTLNFGAVTTSVVLNLATTAAQLVHTNRTILLSQTHTFENAVGGSGDDFLTGGSGNNILDGRNGNDSLNGFTGSDTLRGGAGDDTYLFGAASSGETDVLTEASSSGSDTLNFGAVTTSVVLNLAATAAQLVHTNRTILLSQTHTFENAVGGSGDDVLTGGSGNNILDGRLGNDTLNGFTGSDTLIGGFGNDTYLFSLATPGETDRVEESFGQGSDTLSFSANTTGITVNLSETSVQLVHTDRSLVLSSGSTVENVLGGSGNDVIFGNSAANELSGNSGNDLLVGLAGNDTLNGGPGFDVLVGGRNQDVLQGSIGEELLISGFTKNLIGIDDELAFLLNVQSLWAAPAAFADRVQSLTSILGGGTTVRNDSAVDTLTSNADGSLDWLFAALTDGVTKDVADILSLL